MACCFGIPRAPCVYTHSAGMYTSKEFLLFENAVISNIDPHAPPHRYICAPAEAPGALEEADPCEWEGPAGWLPACVASWSNAAAAP